MAKPRIARRDGIEIFGLVWGKKTRHSFEINGAAHPSSACDASAKRNRFEGSIFAGLSPSRVRSPCPQVMLVRSSGTRLEWLRFRPQVCSNQRTRKMLTRTLSLVAVALALHSTSALACAACACARFCFVFSGVVSEKDSRRAVRYVCVCVISGACCVFVFFLKEAVTNKCPI